MCWISTGQHIPDVFLAISHSKCPKHAEQPAERDKRDPQTNRPGLHGSNTPGNRCRAGPQKPAAQLRCMSCPECAERRLASISRTFLPVFGTENVPFPLGIAPQAKTERFRMRRLAKRSSGSDGRAQAWEQQTVYAESSCSTTQVFLMVDIKCCRPSITRGRMSPPISTSMMSSQKQ